MTSILLGLVVAANVVPVPTRATALPAALTPPGRSDIREIAARCAADVGRLAPQGVRLGRVSPAVPAGADCGAAVELELKAALGPLLNPKAALELTGTYAHEAEPGLDGKLIRLTTKVTDTTTGRVVHAGAPLPIQYVHDVTRFTGPNGVIAASGQASVARAALDALAANPTAVVGVDGVAADPASPFRAEVRGTGLWRGLARPAVLRGADPFVRLPAGAGFEVAVTNHANRDVSFRLSVDGVDQFSFSDDRIAGAPKFASYLLPRANNGVPGEVVVRGWHTKFDPAFGTHRTRPFTTVPPDGRPAANVGLIAVAFSDVVPRAGGVPVIEPPTHFVTIRFRRDAK